MIRKIWFEALILCICANTALGGVIVSAPAAGWADPSGVWPASGEEYRWGATARNMVSINGDWELGIGNTSEMTEGGATQSDLLWNAASSYPFELSYNSTTEEASWTVGGSSVVLQNPATLFSDMYIQLKGRPSSSEATISIADTTLTIGSTVEDIDDFAAGYGESADLKYVHINTSEGLLSELDFILAGTLNIDWSGAAPSRDAMGMHVKMTQIPEPASIAMIILISVTGLFVRRRFRS